MFRNHKPVTDLGNLIFDDLLPAFIEDAASFDGSIVQHTSDVAMQRAFRAEVQRILDERDLQAMANYLGRVTIERLQGKRGPMVDIEEFRGSAPFAVFELAARQLTFVVEVQRKKNRSR